MRRATLAVAFFFSIPANARDRVSSLSPEFQLQRLVMKRRRFLAALALLACAPRALTQETPLVEVWRSATCGCCGEWVKHLNANGFATKVNFVEDTTPMRRALGIPEPLASCHTAKVGGYAIEGHVPASDIRRLLAQRPKARGLAAPGMPAGSPGMDVPGSPPYEVLLVENGGTSTVFARHVPR